MAGGSKWTLKSLHAHFKALRTSDIQRLKERFKTQNRTLKTTAVSVAARFMQGNEFRAALEDAAKRASRELMPRTEADAQFEGLRDKIEKVAEKASDTNAATKTELVSRLDALVSRVGKLENRVGGNEGVSTGTASAKQSGITMLVAISAVVSMLMGILIPLLLSAVGKIGI